jgi:MYXO-CTERM domain-containing protein
MWVILWLAAGSCSRRSAAPAPAQHAASPQFDVSAVVRQVELAFRADRDGFRGGPASFDVQASGRGALRLTSGQGAPLLLETERLGRETPGPCAARSVHADAHGELDIDRGAAIEHLRNFEGGMEQSWRFAGAPAGGGDLVVRVRVAGQAFAGETPSGIHFRDSDPQGVGMRYGTATWIDARGERTDVPARFDADAVELRVAAVVVDRSAYPAVLDPVVSPEIGLDQPYVPNPTPSQRPDVASDGTDYLVVWTSAGLYGARVTADGRVLDRLGFRISQSPLAAQQPSVIWEGSQYLVVWRGVDVSGSPFLNYTVGARVSPSGAVDPEFIISQSNSVVGKPVAALRGPESLVVWADGLGTTTGPGALRQILGARVAAGGGVLDAADLPISASPGLAALPTVASNGAGYLVAWADTRDSATNGVDVHAVQVDATGTPGPDLALVAVPGSQSLPTAASDGVGYFVVWTDNRNVATNGVDLYGTYIDGSGTVVTPDGTPIVTTTTSQTQPDLAWDGAEFVLAWSEGGDIHAARMNGDGSLVDPAGFVVSATPHSEVSPRVVVSSAGALIVWEDDNGASASDIYAARVVGDTVLDPSRILITAATHFDNTPAIASNGVEYLVVWEDTRNNPYNPIQGHYVTDIYGVRVDAGGNVLDPSALAISTASASQLHPAVASNGTDFMVVWYDYRNYGDPQPSDVGDQRPIDLYATRVKADGTVVDPNGFVVVQDPPKLNVTPAIASNGVDYLVAWFLAEPTPSMFYERVGADGTLQDPTPLSLSSQTAGYPAATFDGTNYVIAWASYTGPVYSARVVPATGQLLDSPPIRLGPYTANPDSFYGGPAIASAGGTTLVVWEDSRRGSFDIFGARLAADGTVLDPGDLALSTAPGDQRYPSVAWNGSAFLVAWIDFPGQHVSATYVDPAGTVLYPEGFAVSGSTAWFTGAASVPRTSTVVFRSDWDIAARVIEPDACSADADCPSIISSCLVPRCVSGSCVHQLAATACFFEGACHASGEVDPQNACGACQPAISQSGYTVLMCTALDECHTAGTCSTSSGCSNPPVADGTSCTGGSCQLGVCVPRPDAGPPDAAPPTPDAAPSPPDAAPSPPDAAPSSPDAARPPAADGAPSAAEIGGGGCGCAVGTDHHDAPALPLLLVLASLLLAPRRRR